MIQPYLTTCLLKGSTHLLHTHKIHFLGGPAVLAGSPSQPAQTELTRLNHCRSLAPFVAPPPRMF